MRSFSAIGIVHFMTLAVTLPRHGPFRWDVTSMTKCENSGTNQVEFPTKMYKRRDLPPFYNGTATIGVPWDERFSIDVEIAAWGNQGYRRRYLQHTFKGCKKIMEFTGGFFKSVYRSGGVEVDECPFPAAVLHLKGMDLQFNVTQFKTMYYNKYKCIFTYFQDETKVGCFIWYADVTPA